MTFSFVWGESYWFPCIAAVSLLLLFLTSVIDYFGKLKKVCFKVFFESCRMWNGVPWCSSWFQACLLANENGRFLFVMIVWRCAYFREYSEHLRRSRDSSRSQHSRVRHHRCWRTSAFCWTRDNWTSTSRWSCVDQCCSRDANNCWRSGSRRTRLVNGFIKSTNVLWIRNCKHKIQRASEVTRACRLVWCHIENLDMPVDAAEENHIVF